MDGAEQGGVGGGACVMSVDMIQMVKGRPADWLRCNRSSTDNERTLQDWDEVD